MSKGIDEGAAEIPLTRPPLRSADLSPGGEDIGTAGIRVSTKVD